VFSLIYEFSFSLSLSNFYRDHDNVVWIQVSYISEDRGGVLMIMFLSVNVCIIFATN